MKLRTPEPFSGSLEQLALFDLPAGSIEPMPEPTPRRTTANAGRNRAHARREYERYMRNGGFDNAAQLMGFCISRAIEAGIDLSRHRENLDNADKYRAGNSAYYERNSSGKRRITWKRIRSWWDNDTAQAVPLWHTADTLTHLAELRDVAASFPWPARIKYSTTRREGGKGDPRRVTEGTAGDTARRVYLTVIAHAIETGSVTNVESVRDVAIRAKVSATAADRALRALTHLGLLAFASSRNRTTNRTANRYRVVPDPTMLRGHCRNNGFTCPLGLSPVVPTMAAANASTFTAPLAQHSAFRSGTGLRHDVWHAVLLADGSATVPQLTTALGRTPRSMRRQVAALMKADLLERFDDGTLRARIDRPALDAAAENTGAADRTARQAQRYEQHRIDHTRETAIVAARANGLEVRGEAVTGTSIVLNRDTGETMPLSAWFEQYRHPQPEPEPAPVEQPAPTRRLQVVA